MIYPAYLAHIDSCMYELDLYEMMAWWDDEYTSISQL